MTTVPPSPRPARRAVPAWLSHPLGWRSGPVPRAAVVRGALSAGPLLALGVAGGRLDLGVLAGLGAMFAGLNDRPGTRRTGVVHIGLPATAGAFGLLCGALLAATGGRWSAVPALFALGWLSGALSVGGPVWSSAAMQMLVTAALGAGMPPAGSVWPGALCYLGGAAWLLLLRFLLRAPARRRSARWDGEREAVAAVFDALADALRAVGGPDAGAARRRLTAAQQRADESVRLMTLLPWPFGSGGSASAYRLVTRFGAATALCEAGIALLWEGRPLPREIAEGPRRLAAAVRADGAPGALPSPASDTVQRVAFDRALLDAAIAFDRGGPGEGGPAPYGTPAYDTAPYDVVPHAGTRFARRPRPLRGLPRRVARLVAPARRENGLRVGLCVAASTAVALSLHADHWYWLPITAAFLVKPDLGPLFSRVVNRVAGTAAGVLLFTLWSAVAGGPGGTWWLIALVVAGGALLPVATRHFAFQTAVATLLVLSFVYAAGDTAATADRLLDTALACALVLLVGHLPHLTDPRIRVGHRCAAALRHTERYLRHVLDTPPPDDGTATATATATASRTGTPAPDAAPAPAPDAAPTPAPHPSGIALRHAAYRALAEARAVAETAAAELPGPRRTHRHDWAAVMVRAERIVEAATVCAVRVEQGVPRPPAAEVRAVTGALAAMADALEEGRAVDAATLPRVPSRCRTLEDVRAHLHGIHALTATGSGP
ncbi:FUSC family protein [Streptomyces sp. NPDC093085]|uniref:FUSC family protein n=1 Tax=Streptomyces sp. NPDC093085 TaxID=3155068 RepID=UPI003433CAF0